MVFGIWLQNTQPNLRPNDFFSNLAFFNFLPHNHHGKQKKSCLVFSCVWGGGRGVSVNCLVFSYLDGENNGFEQLSRRVFSYFDSGLCAVRNHSCMFTQYPLEDFK